MSDKDRYILAFDTTAFGVSVSVATIQGRLISTKFEIKPENRSSKLFNLIDESLTEAGIGLKDIDFLCLANGPGSFTGMRIGLAIAKSLSVNLGIETICVPTLRALAVEATVMSKEHIWALLPAGRGEMFMQCFRVENNSLFELTRQTISTVERLFEFKELFSSVVFVGMFDDSLLNQFDKGVQFDHDWLILNKPFPLSVGVVKLVVNGLSEGGKDFEKRLLPNYVRESLY